MQPVDELQLPEKHYPAPPPSKQACLSWCWEKVRVVKERQLIDTKRSNKRSCRPKPMARNAGPISTITLSGDLDPIKADGPAPTHRGLPIASIV